MRALLRVGLKSRLSLILLAAVLVSTSREHVNAQQPPMRWDGLFELITGRYDYPPPWPGPLRAADAPSRVSRHAISGDGRYVVFDSDATNLGTWTTAVYRRDRRTGQLEVINVGLTGNASISADGNHVAFQVCDPFMRPDGAPICDVWAVDTRSWTWTPLSTTPGGTFGDDESSDPVLSADGRYLVFSTRATNLGVNPGGIKQIVWRDRDTDNDGIYDEPGAVLVETITVGLAGGTEGNADSDTAEVSDDGRFVAFRSAASNLVPGDTNFAPDVFQRDRQTGMTWRVNVRSGGYQSPHPISSAHISMTGDGRYVAFTSDDPILTVSAIGDVNGVDDVFVYDRLTSSTTRIDVGWGPPIAGGYIPGNGPTRWPTLSADGRYVSLQSAATNVETPSALGGDQAYVFDRMLVHLTRVSIRSDGLDPDQPSVRPAVSGDGSVVLFSSQASNLANIGFQFFDQLYAAVHMEVTPSNVLVPGGPGSQGTFTVTTQQHTLWWAEWDWMQYWFGTPDAPFGVGNGAVTFHAYEANPNPTQRSIDVHIGQSTVTFTQDVGVSVTSVSPASGGMSGGTTITVTGTGFAPGATVYVAGGQPSPTQFIDSTTLVATTPAYSQRGPVLVLVGLPDGRYAWLDNAFTYLDDTPPLLFPSASGNLGQNGWYTSNVAVNWAWWDPESPVTSTTCADSTVTTDTAGTTFACTATSEGGTGSGAITIKRDATPPTATITNPVFTMYDTGASVMPAFTCNDATSGAFSCVSSTNGGPLDTFTPGYNTFSVMATDQAGNTGMASVEYAIGNDVCTYPMPDLKAWWRFEGDTRQWMNSSPGNATRVGLTSDVFVDGIVGQAYRFEGANGYLSTGMATSWWNDEKFAIAAWVKPSANTLGTIVRRREAYAVARLANGNLAWAFRKFNVPGLTYLDTGVKVPLNLWSHVVVVLEDTVVRTYLNGRLAHTATNIGDVYNMTPSYGITLGGAEDRPDYFKGALDEIKVFDHGITAQRIEQLFLSGAAGACVHKHTAFQITEPIPASFGSSTYAIDARLVDDTGNPVAGRSVRIESQVSSWPYSTITNVLVTDADGRVHWDTPLRGAARMLYDQYVYVTFEGDNDYTRVLSTPDVLVGKGTPVITWPAPAPITYGTFLSNTQLNATTTIPGTFVYSPAWGMGLPAGTQTLSVTFTPNDTANYNTATATVQLTVNKATPIVTVTGGTFAYDAAPHAATGTVKNSANITIGTPTFTYNGSSTPPVDAGTYAVVASFAGNANYESASASTTLTITKATPTVTVTGGSFVFDGQPHGATGSATGIGGVTLAALTFTYNGASDVPVNAGSYAVVGSFAGDTNYVAASGTSTLVVQKASPALTWAAPAGIVYGTSLAEAQLNASASVAGTFAYSPAAGTVLNAGAAQTLSALFTPADSANYTPVSTTVAIDVARATPSITVTGGAFVYDGQPHAAASTLTGVGGATLEPLTFTYNGSGDVPINAGSYDVVASFAGDSNYEAVSANATLTIAKAPVALTWNAPAAIVHGTPLGAAQLNASADIAGAFSYSPAAGTVLDASPAHTLTASFTPADAVNYESGNVTTAIAVTKATAAVSVTGGTFTYDGQPHGATVSVTGAGGVVLSPVVVTYNGSPAVPVNVGSYDVSVTFAGNGNYEQASGTATLTITRGTPSIAWNAPASIVYGAALGAAQLNATASVPGTFSYAPAAGTVLGAGAGHVLSVTFTPSDTANYSGASSTTTINVAQAPLLVRASDATKPFGAPLPAFTATFAGFVNGDSPASLSGALGFSTPATQTSAVGTYPIVPGGLSSPNYAIGFAAGTLTIVKGAVSIAVSTAPEPSGFDMAMTFSANVTAVAPASGTPQGTVRFLDGSTLLGTATLSAGGSASLTTAGLPVGTRTIAAEYDGDASFETGSGSSSHVVKTAAMTPTISITSNRNPATIGQSVTLTANVSLSGGVTGTVAFYDGATLLGSAPIALGKATWTTTTLPLGSHAITARFLGNASTPPSVSPVFVEAISTTGWKNRVTTTTLASSANPSLVDGAVTFTATLTGSTAVPTGRVLFMMNGTVIGDPLGVPVTVVSGTTVQAAISVPALAHGKQKVTATYLGDPTYKGSSGALTQTVN